MTREQQIAEAFEYFHTDKGIHNYAPVYASLPEDIESIFEVGIYWGGSLLTWRKFFPQADILGMDINLSLLESPESKWEEHGGGSSIVVIQDDLRSFDPDHYKLPNFDLVIDDGTHETEHILSMWDKMHSRANRFYIIEDVYLSRMETIWKHIAKDVPKAQLIFWRTSDHCGDDRILPDSDSHCLVVKL